MSSYVSPALRRLVELRAEDLCEYCLIHADDTFLGCQMEHIISEKHGGQTVDTNLALACVFCNRAKGSDIGTLSPRTGNLCRLYNPRNDRGSEYFRLDRDRIVGINEIGEATAAMLAFNHPDRILERAELAKVNRYPCAAALRRITAV
jgi:hypothetical protein